MAPKTAKPKPKPARGLLRGSAKQPTSKTTKARKQRAATKVVAKVKASVVVAAKAAVATVATKPKPRIERPLDRTRQIRDTHRRDGEPLGEVTAPSGRLAMFDVGLLDYLPRHALEPAMIITDVPADRRLPVIGFRVGKGRFAECWDHVVIELGAGDIARSKKLGAAGVDFARLICMDLGTLEHWEHDDSLDGKADLVVSGRDSPDLARVMRATPVKEGFGWVDLAVADAEAKADKAARLKKENRWLLTTELRLHSHHHLALAAARRSPHGAGTIEVNGSLVCLVFTSWGNGIFPIYLDLGHDDQPVRLRIQLAPRDPS